jgi:two-component system, cell cycle response regulator DivK
MPAPSRSTILVVDDYMDNRVLLCAWLRAKGFRVVEAQDGKEGVLQANRAHPDLILMDLAMPELDGVEATRQIRQRHSLAQTPIFAVSAFATHDVKVDALAAGCNEVFSKPLDLDSLLRKINSALGSNNASDAAPMKAVTVH